MNPEQAKAAADMIATLWEGEFRRAMGSKVPNIYGPSADAEAATT